MNVTFYTFAKKLNSTARPSGGATLNCYLKRGSSTESPYLEVSTEDPTSYNYVYIPKYNRYYYVVDWTFRDGLWNCMLDVDVLASYRTEIGATNLYILRTSDGYDNRILDTMYPVVKGGDTIIRSASTGWTRQYNAGSYVVGLISKSAADGAVAYYVVPYTRMKALRQAMMSTSMIDWADIENFTQDIAKAFMDPFQYVASCTWFPFSVPSSGTEEMSFGYWSSGIWAGILSTGVYVQSFSLDVPQNYAGGATAWRRLAPYAEYTLLIPPFGTLTLDSLKMASTTNINIQIITDPITGLATLNVFDDYGNILGSLGASLGVPVQLAQITTDYAGMINGFSQVASGGIGSALRGDMIGAITNGISGLVSAAQAAMPTVTTSGSTGGTAGISPSVQLIAHFRNVVDEDNETLGRPYCKVGKPSDFAGAYILATGGSKVSCAGTLAEKEEIKRYIETGFYYE